MDPGEAGPRREALDGRVEELYAELRKLAGSAMARQSAQHTLQPTALVNEAWLRLARAGRLDVADRSRFLALASKVMRQILVDHARRKGSQKRSGDKVATVELRED